MSNVYTIYRVAWRCEGRVEYSMGLKFKKISFSLLKLSNVNFAKGYPKYLDPKIVFTIGKSTEGY